MTALRWKTAIMYCVVCGVGLSLAAAGTAKKRHHHGAHVHGTATVNIAIEEGIVKLTVRAAKQGG